MDKYDPDYGDYLYDQWKDERMEQAMAYSNNELESNLDELARELTRLNKEISYMKQLVQEIRRKQGFLPRVVEQPKDYPG